jgi:MerR family transcriptional regulator/heat shock protein HspR
MKTSDPLTSISLQPFEPVLEGVYSIEAVVHITQTPRHQIAVYCLRGLITPVTVPEHEGWWFDHEAIRALRRIQRMRAAYGINLDGLRVVSGLLREIEHLREELRCLRR